MLRMRWVLPFALAVVATWCVAASAARSPQSDVTPVVPTVPTPPPTGLPGHDGPGRQSATTGLLVGRVYYDVNANYVRDTTETYFPRPIVLSNLGAPLSAFVTGPFGAYVVMADSGVYDLRLPTVPDNFQVLEGANGYQGVLRAGQAVAGLDFGVAPIPARPDVRVTLTPYAAALPGRPARYRARVENVGTTVADGQLSVTLAPQMTYIGAVPAPAYQQGHTLTWNFNALPAFGAREYDITFSLPVTAPPGTTLTASAGATLTGAADVQPADNADVLNQQIVAAISSPHTLTVNHAQLSLAQVANGEMLDYLIRFDNVGTDSALTLTISDSLPADLLQLSTVRFVGTSHNCQWSINADGILMMSFPGIRLPYRAIDALRSQGFVRFQVRPRTTLSAGTIIPGRADIGFNANPPTSTNGVATIVGSVAATPDAAAAAPWALYPNPTSGAAPVELTGTAAQPGTATTRLLDATGRTLKTSVSAVAAGDFRLPLDVRGVAPGVYVVRLALPGAPEVVRRLVVR